MTDSGMKLGAQVWAALLIQVPFLGLLNAGPHSQFGFVGMFFYIIPIMIGPNFDLTNHSGLFLFEVYLVAIQWVLLMAAMVSYNSLSRVWKNRHS
jgi:hypothetical protein